MLVALAVTALALAACGSDSDGDGDGGVASAEECLSSEPNPVEAAGAEQQLEELSESQAEALYGAGGEAPEGFFETTTVYTAGTKRAPVVVSVTALGSEQNRIDNRAGFSDSLAAQGAEPTEVTIGGTEATEFQAPGGDGLAIYAYVGCYGVSLAGPSAEDVRDQAESIIGATA